MKRWNLLDAALIALVISIAACAVAGYRRFEVPAPELVSVTPGRVVAGAGRALVLRGRYLHPWLRAYAFPSGRAPAIRDAALAASQEAKPTAMTATQFDLTLPPVQPGVYDLYVFDEFQQVAFAPRAFTVVPPVYQYAEATATIRLYTPEGSARFLVVGDHDQSAPAEPDAPPTDGALVTGVRIDPIVRPQLEMRIAPGPDDSGAIWLGSRASEQQIDVDLRVPLAKSASGDWLYHGVLLRTGQAMEIAMGRFTGHGRLIAVGDPRPVDGRQATQP